MSHDILLNLIDTDPHQVRTRFDETAITELAESIDANGLLVPILVRPTGERFTIVHGERRWRAMKLLGRDAIPAIVKDIPQDEARWLGVVENIQRADLTPMEEANAYHSLLQTGITQTELGRRIGKSQSHIATKLRLLKLTPDAQDALQCGSISEGHGKQLLRIADSEKQQELCRQALDEAWTVGRLHDEVDAALWQGIGFHPMADVIPLMSPDEQASLVESIRANGLRDPITIDRATGTIIDGRCRYLACKELGITPTVKYWEGDDPLSFILSMNLYRAHYTPDQRAAIGCLLDLAASESSPRASFCDPGGNIASIDALSGPG